MFEMMANPPLKTASREDQLRAIEENGVMGALSWGDVFFDIESNQMAAKLYGEAVGRIVDRPRDRRGADARPIRSDASGRSSTRVTTRRSTATTSRSSTCARVRSAR